MKSFLQVEELTKSFGDRILFQDITFGINEGDKVGLIAKNGMGKTTLLQIIAGKEPYDSGEIVFCKDLKLGYLPQLPELNPDLTVLDACLDIADDSTEAIRNYESAVESNDADAIAEAIQQMDARGAWDYEDRMKRILSELHITKMTQPVSQLSGGQVKRVALAKVLINEPEMLILDEPTNHLDVDIIEWLEDYLKRSRIALLMVTHDRYFLDKVCTKIIEIDDHQLYSYNGNYDYYLSKREERLDAQNAETAKIKNILRTELDWMRRQPQARGSKAKFRIDAFHELNKKANARRDDKSLALTVGSSYIGSKIFEAKDVCKRFGDKVILKDFNYVFARYEKVGIVGDNGVGKSTFIKMLQGIVSPDSGSFDVGETVKFGYYSQDGIQFDEQEKVIDAVRKIAEYVVIDEKTKYTASQFLQLFLFSPESQQNYIYKLSGGEKRRLYLATVLMRQPNFLILDEPTNDLDIVTLGILENFLHKFKGCVIIVSHDRFFMDRTVDHLFVFEGNGVVRDFPGNYSDYREWKRMRDAQLAEEAKAATEKPQKQTRNEHALKVKLTFKERQELDALTEEISKLEQEKKELEDALSTGALSVDDITEKSKRLAVVTPMLDDKEMRWLELSEKE